MKPFRLFKKGSAADFAKQPSFMEGNNCAALGDGDVPYGLSAASIFDDAFARAAMRTASLLRWFEGDVEFVTVFALDDVRNDYVIRQAGQIVRAS